MRNYQYAQTRVRRLTVEQRREAVERYTAGETYASIAARFGVAPSAIAYHVSKRTVLRSSLPKSQQVARRRADQPGRLSTDDRAAAVLRVNAGESCAAVAADLGVTPAAIAYHVRRAREAVA